MVEVERTGDELTIRVMGVMDEAAAADLREVLQKTLVNGRLRSIDVIVDLRACPDYNIGGRAEFCDAHALLVRQARRCVYIADRPRVRGMVLLSMTRAHDVMCRAVPSPELAARLLENPSEWTERSYEASAAFATRRRPTGGSQ